MAVVFGLGLYLFALLASEMRAELGFGTRTIGLVTAAAQISFLLAAFACPRLTKRFSEGSVIVMAVGAAGILLSAVSAAQTALLMAMFVGMLGACAAFMVIPTVGVISRTVAFQYRSRVNGLVSSGTAYGQLAAGTLAPWLVVEADWRAVWLILGLGSIGVAIIGLTALKLLVPAAFDKAPAAPPKADQPKAPTRAILTRR
jgi:MFS family permease